MKPLFCVKCGTSILNKLRKGTRCAECWKHLDLRVGFMKYCGLCGGPNGRLLPFCLKCNNTHSSLFNPKSREIDPDFNDNKE
jgi:hypothetical protein